MAKVKLNPILEQIRGRVGDLVFRRYEDEVVISQTPDFSGVTPSEAQLAHRERFRRAALYGKMVMADPEAKAVYVAAAERKGKPVFSLTLADFFNAPSIEEVDVSAYSGQAGDKIGVEASDDLDVQRVEVAVVDSEGAVLEEGEATRDGLRWTYTAQADVASGTTVRIEERAYDRPGGVGEESSEVTVPS